MTVPFCWYIKNILSNFNQ